MILKFDRPLDIQEARTIYNDRVTFITSSDEYPKVSAIEFTGDPKLIFKRDALEPKITKKLNKIIKAYEKKITRLWNRSFKEVKEAVVIVHKDETFKVSKEQKIQAHEAIAGLITSMADAAEKPYRTAYETGKMRGQILSGQEIDPEITDSDEIDLQDLLDSNAKYLSKFGNDIGDDLDELLDAEYGSPKELSNAIDTKVKGISFSRALMYAAAIVGAAVMGTINTLKQAKPSEGHRVIGGGIWTPHQDEGLGGEICNGCEANSGKWFSLDEFLVEYGNQNCLSRCRCDLRYGDQIVAP